jgi:hypothetical protein
MVEGLDVNGFALEINKAATGENVCVLWVNDYHFFLLKMGHKPREREPLRVRWTRKIWSSQLLNAHGSDHVL